MWHTHTHAKKIFWEISTAIGNERGSFSFFSSSQESNTCYLLFPLSEQSKSESYNGACVSLCFRLSTHPSPFQAIHFLPSECAINLDGLCLKGFAYTADTLSKAVRLPLSPVCLWQTWWRAWQSWERKQQQKGRARELLTTGSRVGLNSSLVIHVNQIISALHSVGKCGYIIYTSLQRLCYGLHALMFCLTPLLQIQMCILRLLGAMRDLLSLF